MSIDHRQRSTLTVLYALKRKICTLLQRKTHNINRIILSAIIMKWHIYDKQSLTIEAFALTQLKSLFYKKQYADYHSKHLMTAQNDAV